MKKATRNSLLIGLAVIMIVALLGMITSGFQKWKFSDIKDNVESRVLKERNPDNLIDEVDLETGKDPTSDVTFTVDKYGRVKLTGTASADSVIAYAEVTLAPGTYYLTGDDAGSSNITEFLAIYNSSNQFVARADMGAFTVDSQATFTVGIAVKEAASFRNVSIAPVLSTAEDTPFFAEH